MKKQHYIQPMQEVISLEMMREAMQAFSGTGQDLDNPVTGGNWDDLFNNVIVL